MSRESCDVDKIGYWPFQWTTDFNKDSKPAFVPVWITLLSLSLNFYHEAFLKNILALIFIYICRDNATHCAMRTNGTKVCVLMNISQDPIWSFWIGPPKNPMSFLQEVIYETLTAFCSHCKVQGHNLSKGGAR